MKRYSILLVFCLLLALPVLAQEMTLEYNVGFGTYKMGSLKDYMGNYSPQLNVNNVKQTDNFPGYITHQAKLGIEWKKLHQVGILLDYMNTVSNKGVSDYSASYNITFRVKGLRLGGFYRFALPDFSENLVRPYLQVSTGVVLNNGKFSEGVELSNGQVDKALESLDGANFFIEPAIGAKIRLHRQFALNVNVGYEFDVTKSFKYEGQLLTIKPDWSGFRLQGGVIYYIPLIRK